MSASKSVSNIFVRVIYNNMSISRKYAVRKMHMWFWFDVNLGSFLFPGYDVTTLWGLVATCLGLAALAVLYEAMKVYHIYLQQITINSVPRTNLTSSESSSLLYKVTPRKFKSYSRCGSCFKWTLEVLHWSLHTTLGYILMLAVMTYNAYITSALVIGGCLGYWIFGLTLVQLNIQRFRHKPEVIECDKNCDDISTNQQRRASTVSVVAEQLVTEATIEFYSQNNA